MKKCDFCVNQTPKGDCKFATPSNTDCKQATERFFQFCMVKEKNKNNQTYTKNVNINKKKR